MDAEEQWEAPGGPKREDDVQRFSIGAEVEPFSQLGNNGRFEQATDEKLQPKRSADPADQTGSQKRVPLQLKEVIVNTRPAKHRAPR
jgi:hypothetical protein